MNNLLIKQAGFGLSHGQGWSYSRWMLGRMGRLNHGPFLRNVLGTGVLSILGAIGSAYGQAEKANTPVAVQREIPSGRINFYILQPGHNVGVTINDGGSRIPQVVSQSSDPAVALVRYDPANRSTTISAIKIGTAFVKVTPMAGMPIDCIVIVVADAQAAKTLREQIESVQDIRLTTF